MSDDEKQPEEADILQRAEQRLRAWEGAHAVWDETDRWVQGTYDVWPDEQLRATRNSLRSFTARTIIDRTSDNLLPYNPQWHRDDTGEGTDSEEADPVENFVDMCWVDASLQEMMLPAKVMGRNFLKYNYSPVEVCFSPQDEPAEPKPGEKNFLVRRREYEERQWNFNPFSVSVPHPKTILLPPYERRPSSGTKRQLWYRHDLVSYLQSIKDADAENLVRVEVPEYGSDPYMQLLVTEEFSREWHGLVAEGEGLLLVEANMMGIVPFRHAFAGFGDIPGGEDGNNPKYLAQGFLYPARELLQLLDQIISAKAELEMKAAYAPLVAPEQLLERIASLLRQGSNMIPGVLQDIGFLPTQNLPQYLADFQDRVERAIVTATVSTVVFGERPVGVDTLGQHALMFQANLKRMVETMEQVSFLIGEVGSMWLQMLAVWGREVTVRGHSLKPEQLKRNYFIVARFPMADEAVKQQRTQVGAALVQQGLKSIKRHLEEDQGVTDVTGELDRILEDRVRADPVLHSAFAEKKRQELGLQEVYEEQVARIKQERMAAFNQVQAERGQPGVKIPARSEETIVKGAEEASFVRPPPAGPGTGQMTNGRGT